MTATFGHIDEFEEGKEDWIQYVERLEHFFRSQRCEHGCKEMFHSAICHGSQCIQIAEKPGIAGQTW